MSLSVLFIVVLLAACDKKSDNSSVSSTTYRGVIHHNICCQIVIQTIGANLLGQDSWVDSNKNPLEVYHHVFKVSNPCQFGGHSEGDTINFKIVGQQTQTCACCLLFLYTPVTAYPVSVVN